MTSQQKQLDFLQILARPVMYNYVLLNKPNYTGRPYCDRCNKNLTEYFSSKATPNTDLCPDCFQFLKSSDVDIVISAPTSVIHHTSHHTSTTTGSSAEPFSPINLGIKGMFNEGSR